MSEAPAAPAARHHPGCPTRRDHGAGGGPDSADRLLQRRRQPLLAVRYEADAEVALLAAEIASVLLPVEVQAGSIPRRFAEAGLEIEGPTFNALVHSARAATPRILVVGILLPGNLERRGTYDVGPMQEIEALPSDGTEDAIAADRQKPAGTNHS